MSTSLSFRHVQFQLVVRNVVGQSILLALARHIGINCIVVTLVFSVRSISSGLSVISLSGFFELVSFSTIFFGYRPLSFWFIWLFIVIVSCCPLVSSALSSYHSPLFQSELSFLCPLVSIFLPLSILYPLIFIVQIIRYPCISLFRHYHFFSTFLLIIETPLLCHYYYYHFSLYHAIIFFIIFIPYFRCLSTSIITFYVNPISIFFCTTRYFADIISCFHLSEWPFYYLVRRWFFSCHYWSDPMNYSSIFFRLTWRRLCPLFQRSHFFFFSIYFSLFFHIVQFVITNIFSMNILPLDVHFIILLSIHYCPSEFEYYLLFFCLLFRPLFHIFSTFIAYAVQNTLWIILQYRWHIHICPFYAVHWSISMPSSVYMPCFF